MKSWSEVSKLVSVSLLVASPLTWAAGVNGWVSVSATEVGNAKSESPSMSADGRFIAFASDANNLVAGDNNAATDVFLSDWYTGETKLVSKNSRGKQGNGASYEPAISADGRYVAFVSAATNLVASDKNGKDDIFVHDLETGKTRRVSVNSRGKEANYESFSPSLSANGRFIAFASSAKNLVNNDSSIASDIFIHDLVTGKTSWGSVDINSGFDITSGIVFYSNNPSISNDGRYVAYQSTARKTACTSFCTFTNVYRYDRNTGKARQVDVTPTGQEGNSFSSQAVISGNGRYVAFLSHASDLVGGDKNNTTDVFVRDMAKGITERANLNSQGQESPGGSFLGPSGSPGLSIDGRYVSFNSDANNIVQGVNGSQIYLRDRKAKKTQWISKTNSGIYPDSYSGFAGKSSVSADGRHIAFESRATNLVLAGPDTNGVTDVYARDQRILLSKKADLRVRQTDTSDPAKPGQTVTYRMVVKNLGKIAAPNARLVAIPELPVGAGITKVATNKGVCRKGAVTVCKLGRLVAGGSAVVRLQVKLKSLPAGKLPKGGLANRVSVYADPFDTDLHNNRSVETTTLAAN